MNPKKRPFFLTILLILTLNNPMFSWNTGLQVHFNFQECVILAIVFLGLASAFSGIFIYLLILQRRRMLSYMQQAMARDMHDEIGASISNICMLSSLAERNLSEQEAGQGKEFLERIRGEANKIHDTISDTINVIDPAYERLMGLSALLSHHAQEVFRYQPIDFTIQLSEGVKNLRVRACFRRDFFLVLKECLHNISRHAQAREVRVGFMEERGMLHCQISDNGCGFNAKVQGRCNGLKIMARRARFIGARLSVETWPGRGTTVHLYLPLRVHLLSFSYWRFWLLRAKERLDFLPSNSAPTNVLPEIITNWV